MLAALLEVAVGVEAGAGGDEEDHLAGGRIRRRSADGVGKALETAQVDPPLARWPEAPRPPPRRVADQVARGAAFADRLHQGLEAAALQGAAEDCPDATTEGAQRRDRGGHVGRLGVVDIEDAATLGNPLEAVRDAGER